METGYIKAGKRCIAVVLALFSGLAIALLYNICHN